MKTFYLKTREKETIRSFSSSPSFILNYFHFFDSLNFFRLRFLRIYIYIYSKKKKIKKKDKIRMKLIMWRSTPKTSGSLVAGMHRRRNRSDETFAGTVKQRFYGTVYGVRRRTNALECALIRASARGRLRVCSRTCVIRAS